MAYEEEVLDLSLTRREGFQEIPLLPSISEREDTEKRDSDLSQGCPEKGREATVRTAEGKFQDHKAQRFGKGSPAVEHHH